MVLSNTLTVPSQLLAPYNEGYSQGSRRYPPRAQYTTMQHHTLCSQLVLIVFTAAREFPEVLWIVVLPIDIDSSL